MRLQEVREKHGIKRIDFSKVHRHKEDLEEYGTDILICPYCKERIEYWSEDIDDIIRGVEYSCPKCGKWFYAEAEISLNTTCTPMEDAVINRRGSIEGIYQHMDECDEKGFDFSKSIYETVEWNVYIHFARPLFENMGDDK